MLLSACAGGTGTNSNATFSSSSASESSIESAEANGQPSVSSATESLPEGNYKETGKGTMIISSSSGTSENGNVPIIFADKGDSEGLGISVRGFDGSKLSYVYADKILITKEQYGDTDTSIYLQDSAMSVGKHEIEVVQYDNNKTNGKVVTYKTAPYEIKQK